MSLESIFQQDRHTSFINGSFRFEPLLQSVPLISPATQAPWKNLLLADDKLSRETIAAAHESQKAWKSIPPPQRGAYLRKIGTLLIENKDLFAQCMAYEMGKPIKEGAKEVDYAAGFYHWFAGEAERLFGQLVPSPSPNKRLFIIPEPVGVCGIITPWNFPLAMGARKIAAALAAGCTVVVKPSPECPITMCLFAELCRQINLPNGVVNILIGLEKEIGRALLDAYEIRKISFTGSTDVGRYLYKESAATLKKLTLELGGHAPLLVFNDADIGKAVSGTITAKFRNNGQTCVAANRILVQREIYDTFLANLITAVKKLVVGDPFSPDSDLSTILHPLSFRRVQEHIADALDKGAKSILLQDKPFFPAILTDISSDMRIFHEETFGPVVAVTTFKTDEEGLALANSSEYGLAAYIFTESLSRAKHAAEELQYGIIGLNDGLPSTPQASFGGIKNSGFGREGGPSGIREYLSEKYISAGF